MQSQNDVEHQWIFNILLRRLWIILLCAFLGGLIALVVLFNRPLVYQANVNIMVEPDQNTNTNDAALATAEQIAFSYSQMIKDKQILQAAIDELGLSTTPEALIDQITAEPVKGTHLIQLSVVGSSPEEAANLAYALSRAFILYKQSIQTQKYEGLLVDNQTKLDKLKGLSQQAHDQIDTLTTKRTEELTQLSSLKESLIEQKSDYNLLLNNQENLQLKLNQLENHVTITEFAKPSPVESTFPTGTVTTTLRINPNPVIEGENHSDIVAGEILVSTYVQGISSRSIIEAALLKLGSQEKYEDLINNIIVKTVPGTTLINLVVTGRDPAESVRLANTIATEFINQNKSNYQTKYRSQLSDIENQMKMKSATVGHTEAEINYLTSSIQQSRSEISRLENLANNFEVDRTALEQNEKQIRLEMSRSLDVSLDIKPARIQYKTILTGILIILLAGLFGALVGVVLVFVIQYIDHKTHHRSDITYHEIN